jgi:SPP1 gp7 family putative phage head morphogenesis protein
MATKKPNIRKEIIEAKQALKDIMQEELATIAESMIAQIISRASRLNPSKALDAIKDVTQPGVNRYKELLTTALAVIAFDSIEVARKEVPPKKNVRLDEDRFTLSEFDRLPPKLQKKIKTNVSLLIDAQLADLNKAILFQYESSVDSTDSVDLIKKDLENSASDYVTGRAVEGGAGVTAAKMVNAGREAFFSDSDVSEEIEAFQFVNGDPVSPICQDLAGTVFAKDDPEAARYTPPLHFNCKSYIVPILKGNLNGREVGELKPSKADLDKHVQFSEDQV